MKGTKGGEPLWVVPNSRDAKPLPAVGTAAKRVGSLGESGAEAIDSRQEGTA
jgi:hypothetical protein